MCACEWSLSKYFDVSPKYLLEKRALGFTVPKVSKYDQEIPQSHTADYKKSPAAIIRNSKIWNIILLLTFFQN